jgi:hypothetical protein
MVQAVGRHLDRRGVADRDLGQADIVVDGLGDADQLDPALLGEAAQNGQRAVAADADQGIEIERAVALDDLVAAVDAAAIVERIIEGVAPVRGAEDRAGHPEQGAVEEREVKLLRLDGTGHEAGGALVDADHLPAVALDRPVGHGADHGVQPRAIAAAGQDADPFDLRHGRLRWAGLVSQSRGSVSGKRPEPASLGDQALTPGPCARPCRRGLPPKTTRRYNAADSESYGPRGARQSPESMTKSDQAAIRQKLAELLSEHRDLDDVIAQITGDGPFDQLQVQRLKKRKLMLKDQISQLESELLPDIIA